MRRYAHQQQVPADRTERWQIQSDMTPGRAPAEGGGDITSPSHERWEQDTYDRDPVEGPDFD